MKESPREESKVVATQPGTALQKSPDVATSAAVIMVAM